MRNFCLFFVPVMAAVAVLLFIFVSHLNKVATKHSGEGPYSLARLQAAELVDVLD